ncbi:MAG: DUF1569 domain-containing protein [Candidatus Hydrogenedentes bacterium]|nr:DUF1569 domain-containing protein [Candidatus Hydrogenedentota bacterium]
MRTFDHDYVNDIIARLNRIKPGAKPVWGTMTPEQMIGHLAFWVRYSMGKGEALPFAGNWLTRNVIGPLTLSGWLPVPRNLKVESKLSVPQPVPADTETFHAVLETYLELVQSGEIKPHAHPFFGDIGIDGWARMHVVHFEHHLRQFGV